MSAKTTLRILSVVGGLAGASGAVPAVFESGNEGWFATGELVWSWTWEGFGEKSEGIEGGVVKIRSSEYPFHNGFDGPLSDGGARIGRVLGPSRCDRAWDDPNREKCVGEVFWGVRANDLDWKFNGKYTGIFITDWDLIDKSGLDQFETVLGRSWLWTVDGKGMKKLTGYDNSKYEWGIYEWMPSFDGEAGINKEKYLFLGKSLNKKLFSERIRDDEGWFAWKISGGLESRWNWGSGRDLKGLEKITEEKWKTSKNKVWKRSNGSREINDQAPIEIKIEGGYGSNGKFEYLGYFKPGRHTVDLRRKKIGETKLMKEFSGKGTGMKNLFIKKKKGSGFDVRVLENEEMRDQISLLLVAGMNSQEWGSDSICGYNFPIFEIAGLEVENWKDEGRENEVCISEASSWGWIKNNGSKET